MTVRPIKLATGLASLAICTAAQAELLITVNSYDNTSIDVTITGTVDAVNPNAGNYVLWGFDNGGDNSWLLTAGTMSFTDLGSADYSPDITEHINNLGGYFGVRSNSYIIQIGDTVNFNTVTTGGSYDWATYSPDQLVVQVGYTDSNPLIGGTETLAGTAVPEPSSLGLLLGLGALGFIARAGAKHRVLEYFLTKAAFQHVWEAAFSSLKTRYSRRLNS